MNEDVKLTEGRLHQEFAERRLVQRMATEKELKFLSELASEQAAEIQELREDADWVVSQIRKLVHGAAVHGGTLGTLLRVIRKLNVRR